MSTPRKKDEDWRKPDARCFFILINEPGSPLYDGTIVSVIQPSQEAKVKAIYRHRDYPKDEIEMIVPLDRLREETGKN